MFLTDKQSQGQKNIRLLAMRGDQQLHEIGFCRIYKVISRGETKIILSLAVLVGFRGKNV